jgi:CheY-like chemotaxis protein
MNGKIWVESSMGVGSTFHFTAQFSISSASESLHVAREALDLKGLRVLVVDDNATNRRILDEVLRSWGMAPALVENGKQALQTLEVAAKSGKPFPLAVIDFMMPAMNGFELAKRMKHDSLLSGTAIIILTSSGQRGDAVECAELGIGAYLSKPVKQSHLFDAVNMVLSRRAVKDSSLPLVTRHSIRVSKNKLRILLAEDNAVNQKLATRMLEKMGHTVTVAENGRKAVAMWEVQKFDLILMDVQMPELDGFGATAIIRRLEAARGEHIPIIAMTAHAMKGDRERCLDAGMDGYVAKPINPNELFETVEQWTSRNSSLEKESEKLSSAAKALDVEQGLGCIA